MRPPTATAASIMARSTTTAASGMRARARREALRAAAGAAAVMAASVSESDVVATLVLNRSLMIDMRCPPQAPKRAGPISARRGATLSGVR